MDLLLDGWQVLLTWPVLLALFGGCAVGLMFGLTPGLDATSGTALLLAFTFVLDPATAIVLLLSVYMCATYAGSITAIAIGVPGTPASAAAVLDGYVMTKRGQAGRALTISILSSVIGGIVGTAALILLAAPIAKVALQLGSPEYFALTLFALTMIAALVGGQWLKGILLTVLGLLVTTVGIDAFTGYARYTFGSAELFEGVSYIPALIGLFAISEAMFMSDSPTTSGKIQKEGLSANMPSKQDWRRLAKPLSIGSGGGAFIGALPGVGAAAGNWMTYNEARRFSRRPQEFGKGSIEGLAAAESGNNATVSSSLIPLLTLGIPGSPTAAVLLGGLILHGIQPGPRLLSQESELVSVVFLGVLAICLVMLVLGLTAVRLWVSLLQVPKGYIVAVVLVMSFVGAFGLRNSMFDVYLMLGFGLFGYAIRKAGYSVVPIIIALVLGELLETHYRRALIADADGHMAFLHSPVAITLLVLTLLSLVAGVVRETRTASKPHVTSAQE